MTARMRVAEVQRQNSAKCKCISRIPAPTCIYLVRFHRHLSAELVSDAGKPPRIYSNRLHAKISNKQ